MVIYIEYALLENFLFDGILLCLALKAARCPVRWARVVSAAVVGAVFAVLFPLLTLPPLLAYVLKFAVGFLLCLIASDRLKTKKEWGRYALTAVFFFVFTFGFGGVLLGTTRDFFKEKAPSALVITAFAVLSVFSILFIKKLYERRALHAFIYKCTVYYQRKAIELTGFLDSGNRAKKDGLPVCFLSPEILYELRKEELWEQKEEGQVCDEIRIQTLGGEKRLPVFKGEIEIRTGKEREKKEVYFAPAANMLSREYSMILSAYVFERTGEE